MKFCPNCGKRFKDSDGFCTSCGVELKQGADDGNAFAAGLSQAGGAAREAMENAFSEENREKAKAIANEAIGAIKNADFDKGKAMATDGFNKIKASKYGAIVLVAVVVIAIGFFCLGGNSDEAQLNNIGEAVMEVTKHHMSQEPLSEGQIKDFVNLCNPNIRDNVEMELKAHNTDIKSLHEKAEKNAEFKNKLDAITQEGKTFNYKILGTNISGGKGEVIIDVSTKNKSNRTAIQCTKVNDKWYLAKMP